MARRRRFPIWTPAPPTPPAEAHDVPFQPAGTWPGSGRINPVRQRYPFHQEAVPYRSVAEEQAALAAEAADVRRIAADDNTESQAAYEDVANRGSITVIELEGHQDSICNITPPVQVIAFVVPERWMFRLMRVAFEYNDPFFYQTNLQTRLPWQLLVNGVQPPYYGETNARPFLVPPGVTQLPHAFDPLWVKGGDTVSIECVPFGTTIEVNVTARLGGELWRPHSMRLGRPV